MAVVESVRSLALVPQTPCRSPAGECAESVITLPDYLEPGLDIVLVGINPGAYSVRAGHYYAQARQPLLERRQPGRSVRRALEA